MSCCIGRKARINDHNDHNNNQEAVSQELKTRLNSIDSETTMIDVFKSVMESQPQRSTLVKHFEAQHSPELPYFIEDFINWEKNPTKDGAEMIFQKYFLSDSPYQLDVQSDDAKRIRFLLNNYNTNSTLMHDMFKKYSTSSMKDIKNNYNPKP